MARENATEIVVGKTMDRVGNFITGIARKFGSTAAPCTPTEVIGIPTTARQAGKTDVGMRARN